MRQLLNDFTDKDVKNLATNYLLSYDFNQLENITDKWGFFRQIYMENISQIIQTSEEDIRKWNQAYLLDWHRHFSPIEKSAWSSIREMGGIVLYPQFPVFNYFIDFANPLLKIGLELDGKEYHDPMKDYDKDKKLNRFGWKIFRVSGKETNTDYLTNMELDEKGVIGSEKKAAIEHWILNTCDGVLTAIKYWYFSTEKEKENNFCFYLNQQDDDYDTDKITDSEKIDFHSLAKCTLEKHNLAKFKI